MKVIVFNNALRLEVRMTFIEHFEDKKIDFDYWNMVIFSIKAIPVPFEVLHYNN